jgi:hypothetical protein
MLGCLRLPGRKLVVPCLADCLPPSLGHTHSYSSILIHTHSCRTSSDLVGPRSYSWRSAMLQRCSAVLRWRSAVLGLCFIPIHTHSYSFMSDLVGPCRTSSDLVGPRSYSWRSAVLQRHSAVLGLCFILIHTHSYSWRSAVLQRRSAVLRRRSAVLRRRSAVLRRHSAML